jgi:SOS-response transcriptional repressor LexA
VTAVRPRSGRIDPEVRNLVLAALEEYIRTNGWSPTVRDLALATGRTVGTIHPLLGAMRRDGLVDWDDGRARTLRVLSPGRRYG